MHDWIKYVLDNGTTEGTNIENNFLKKVKDATKAALLFYYREHQSELIAMCRRSLELLGDNVQNATNETVINEFLYIHNHR